MLCHSSTSLDRNECNCSSIPLAQAHRRGKLSTDWWLRTRRGGHRTHRDRRLHGSLLCLGNSIWFCFFVFLHVICSSPLFPPQNSQCVGGLCAVSGAGQGSRSALAVAQRLKMSCTPNSVHGCNAERRRSSSGPAKPLANLRPSPPKARVANIVKHFPQKVTAKADIL